MKVDLVFNQLNLPDFIVVGAGKSGTTSIHHYLKEHPEIYLPEAKETWFFHLVSNPNKAILKLYPSLPQSIFSYLNLFTNVNSNQICGEVTPSYLYYYDLTISNIKKYHPNWQDLKIVIILREPIEKIISHYNFVKNNDLDPENLTLNEAIKLEIIRKKRHDLLPDLFYVDNTMYHNQVKSYLDAFKNVKIFLYEDLKNNPKKLTTDLFNFLEVDPTFAPKNIKKIYNKSTIPRIPKNQFFKQNIKFIDKINFLYEKLFRRKSSIMNTLKYHFQKEELIDDKTINILKEKFKPEITKLESLIQKDLSNWLKKYD